MSSSDPSAPIMRKGTNAAQTHPACTGKQFWPLLNDNLVRELFFSGGSCRVSISRLGYPFWFFDALLALAHGLTGKLRHLHSALALTDQHNVPFLLSFYTQYM